MLHTHQLERGGAHPTLQQNEHQQIEDTRAKVHVNAKMLVMHRVLGESQMRHSLYKEQCTHQWKFPEEFSSCVYSPQPARLITHVSIWKVVNISWACSATVFARQAKILKGPSLRDRSVVGLPPYIFRFGMMVRPSEQY